uniref:Ig-like domain-containing protein n=1 Tax=Macrostomum lignano TaxID=282301 RepID=A0A1I8HS08_9PLAT
MNDPKLGAINLDFCQGGEKASKECLPCRAYVICPQNGGWGEWGEWTDCQFNATAEAVKTAEKAAADSAAAPVVGGPDDAAKVEQARVDMASDAQSNIDGQKSGVAMPARGNALELEEDCGKGSRTRVRRCDRPPPDSKGLRCGGGSHGRLQKEDCEVPCSADTDFLAMAKEMLAQDLTETPNQLFYVNYGAPATLDCANEAYSLALSSVKPYQHLQINWRRNNVSVIALQTRLQWFMAQSEEAKGLLTGSDEASKAVSRHTKLEMAQVRSFGTQLTIDPVDADKVGLYACYMLTDKSYPELQTVVMATNAETFMDAQLPSMEAAVVRWYQNGLPKREHLLADWYERNWTLALSYADTGAWECYLVLDSRNQWKTNEFKLSISKQLFFLQKFNDAYLAYFIAGCALILYAIVGFPLAVVTLRQREENWITAEEQRCIEHVRQLNYLYMARYVRRIS